MNFNLVLAMCIFLTGSKAVATSLEIERKWDRDNFVEIIEPEDNIEQKLSWKMFKTDDCFQYNTAVFNEKELRENGLRRCKDGSVSFVQPIATGAGGWEGKCGHTFGANALYSICKISVHPANYFNPYFGDITPGVRPGTLRSGMARIFNQLDEACPSEQGRWIYYKLGSLSNYIQRLKQFVIPKYSHRNLVTLRRFGKTYQRNPVATLIQNPGGRYLHWVTIVDVLEDNNNDCQFVVNHWDNQYQVPCEVLANWSYRVGRSYPIILKSFSVVSFNL